MSYGHFCKRLRDYERQQATSLDYPRQRKPGEILETDWCGDTLPLVYDRTNNQFIQAHFFVATLGFSAKLFVCAYPDERQESWIDAHSQALAFYGKVPRIIKPDNTKTAISKPHRYAPEINPVFALWAAHYAVAIVPARSAKPKDKDRVEDGVGWVQAKLFPELKGQVFFSFADLNQHLLTLLEKLNKKPYKQRPGCRHDIFQEVDLPAMRPLPAHTYQVNETRWVTVSRNGYHVFYDEHHYSVPYQLAGKKVLLVATHTTVELLYNNLRIAWHQRCYSRQQIYVTDPNHMPEKHQVQAQADSMSADRYLQWAQNIGSATSQVIRILLTRYPIEQQAYQSCMGILRLAEKYTPPGLEQACQQALTLGVGGYHQIKQLLDEQAANRAMNALNQHPNIRGGAYYKEKQS